MRPRSRVCLNQEEVVFASYGGRLKSDQEACDDMWKICKNGTCKEIVACMSDSMRAKEEAFVNKTKEHVVFVRVFAPWLQWS